MNSIFRRAINSNMLTTIAIIAMVIGYIGFYFSELLPDVAYIICRDIGRISMPIFVYLLVQGFFYTKNFKKYISRMFLFACITQLLFITLMIINIKYVPYYTSANQVFMTGNILFSFVISLAILKILHEDILIKKWDYNKNKVIKVITIVLIIIGCILIPLDYGVTVPVLAVLLYYIEKIKIRIYIEKNNPKFIIKNILLNSIGDNKIMFTYLMLILMSLIIMIIYFNESWLILFAMVPIALYNGERGKINMKYVYYITFPLQHVVLYTLALLITGTAR